MFKNLLCEREGLWRSTTRASEAGREAASPCPPQEPVGCLMASFGCSLYLPRRYVPVRMFCAGRARLRTRGARAGVALHKHQGPGALYALGRLLQEGFSLKKHKTPADICRPRRSGDGCGFAKSGDDPLITTHTPLQGD